MTKTSRIFLTVLLVFSLLVSGLGGVFGSLPQAQAASTTMVISEVAPAGPGGAADEYIELYNASASTTVNLNGWKLVYRSWSGATDSTTFAQWTTDTLVEPHRHYLVACIYLGAARGVIADKTYNTGSTGALAGAGGGVALRDASTAIVDSIGYGTATNAFVEGIVCPWTANTANSMERLPGGVLGNGTDTDHNNTDFATVIANPQNLASPAVPALGTTAPSAPTALTTTDGHGQISLAWSVPLTDGGATIDGYNVYRGSSASTLGVTPLNGGVLVTGTTYLDASLGDGAHWFYAVKAHNSVGESALSAVADGTTFSVPSPVTTLAAVAGDGTVGLTWSASLGDPQHLSSVGYFIWRGTSAGGEDTSTPVSGVNSVMGLSFTDTTAVNGTTYFYRVTAVNEVGMTGVLSGNEVTATPHVTVTVTAPVIANLAPANLSFTDNVRPQISATYSDSGSPINVASVRLLVDAVNVTLQATFTDSGISYVPASDLSKSSHSVQLDVANTAASPVNTQAVWTFTVGDYNIYFGGMHSHTNLSDGTGTPQQAYDSAKLAGVAFMAVTDHSNWFDLDSSSVLADLASGLSTEWATLKAAADASNVPGTFVGIAGYEMTWSGGPGHINTFNTVGYDTRTHTDMTLTAYYAQLALYPQSISQLNHPGTMFGTFDDFAHWTAEADAVVDLVEVGNGEGVVHQAGYFPSYQYYQMALDKGWHVAPSNNQDNHKGNWMFANDARTVVLAPVLTRDAIYEAIRQRRVYATEDKDLRVTYHLNDAVMGSRLDNPSTLHFNVTWNDAELTDTVSKISVIANGGVVVNSTTPGTSAGTWDFTLPSDPYTFYYVRFDQADTDVAVTAPVWTGDVVKVGVSKVEASQDPQIVGTPVDFTATAYNNGSVGVTNATMEFFKDTIVPENKLGEVTGISLPAPGTATPKITWIPTTAGTWTIYARLTATVGSEVKTSFASTTFTAANPDEVTQVVIDGGHYNAYTTGYYAGNMKTLTAMIKAQKMMPVITVVDHQLTAADLQYAKILILNDPQSKLPTKNYSAAEIQVIKDFVDAGGSLILTSRADYDETSVKSDLTAHSAYQGNVVLEAIGSNLRLNDDEVIDNTSHGPLGIYQVYLDDYTGSKYHLTDGIPVGRTYSFYSGCSVILKAGGSDANVDWLVKGHTTTASLDSDLAGDATPVAMGNVYGLAAEILPGGGKVVVGGTAFFSDFETASADNAYSNKQIINNILNWALLKTIAETRVDANTDGSPDLFGNRVTVEGRVTAQSKAVGPNTAFFDVIYVQDATGGLDVFGISTSAIPLGTLVRVTGIVGQYEGDSQIHVLSESDDILMIDSTPALVSPLSMSTGASMLETSEGWLVKVEGVVTSIVTTGGDNSVYINDGTGVAKVYVNGYVGDGTDNPAMLGAWDPAITVGDWVSAIGLASQDAAGHRLRVRNTAEIVRASRAFYTLAYTAGANGTITGTSPQTVEYGASGTTVTAVPNPGYYFVTWSDGVLTAARTDTNVTVPVNVTAIFSSAIDTFTQVGTITVIKNTVPDGPQDFSFTIAGGVYAPTTFNLDDDADPTLSNTQVFSNVAPGIYTVTEGAATGYTLTNGGTTSSDLYAATVWNLPARTATITLGAGGSATVTFTNTHIAPTPTTGTITVVKDTVPDGPQDFSFTVAGGVYAPTTFNLDDDADPTLSNTQVLSGLLPGTYTVTEGATTGYTLTNGGTTSSDLYAATVWNLPARTATITLGAGGSARVTFTNTGAPGIHLGKVVKPTGAVLPGARLTYTLSYSNTGTAASSPLTITDRLDDWLNEATLSIGQGGLYNRTTRIITWNVGIVPAGVSGTVTFAANVRSLQNVFLVIHNTGSYTTTLGGTGQSNTVETPVLLFLIVPPPVGPPVILPPPPSIAIEVTAPAPLCVDAYLPYKICFTNGIPPYTYTVDFGDGTPIVTGTTSSPCVTLEHAFLDVRQYTVYITVKDGKGLESTYQETFTTEDCTEKIVVYHHNFFIGYPDGTFQPEGNITRAEISAAMSRALGLGWSNEQPGFPDVKPTHWAAGFITLMKQEGFMQGDTGGTFRPDAPITRAEAAAVFLRIAGMSPVLNLTSSSFSDVQPMSWAAGYIEAARQAGLLAGYPDNTFRPADLLSRAEFATLASDALGRKLTSTNSLVNPEYVVQWPDVSRDFWAYDYISEVTTPHTVTNPTRLTRIITLKERKIPLFTEGVNGIVTFLRVGDTITAIVPVDGLQPDGSDPAPRQVKVRIINHERP